MRSPTGLRSEEAARRLAEVGPNRTPRARHESLLRRAARQFSHFFALILVVAAGLAFFAERSAPGSGMGTLGWTILGVVVLNGAFSFWQEYRADRAVLALGKLLPETAKVFRDGIVVAVGVEDVVPGDVVALDQGDRVSADARVIECFGLRVDESTLTGESVPTPRDASVDGKNVVRAGTVVVAGRGTALVFATGASTELATIAELAQASRTPLSPLQREIVRVSRILAVVSVTLGITFAALGIAIHLDLWTSLLFGIGIIVANVPEGLLPQVTLTLAMASRRMAAKNALVRHLPAVEALGSATVICTDKTGTLTENRMTVRRVFASGAMRDPDDLAGVDAELLACAASCHALHETDAGLSGDPMEIALVEMARRAGAREPAQRTDEIPFDSDRRRLSTIHGGVLYTKGAPEVVLSLASGVRRDGVVRPLDEASLAELEQAERTLAEGGLRVLALAYRKIPEGARREDLERELVVLGVVGLYDPPRDEVPEAIAKCQAAGIRVIMITGDHPLTACAIAREIGLARDPRAITGDALRRMSEAQLALELEHPDVLFARTDADLKTRVVHALQRKGEVVAVTGDGVNDAPALRAAAVGIAMGRSGTDVAREAADIVLADDHFATIVDAIEEGRAVFANIRKFLTYVLTSNVPELVPYLAFVLFRIPLPLTIVQILAVDLGTDIVPALALGAEPPDPEVMREPPRSSRDRLIDMRVLLRGYVLLGLLEATAAMAAYAFVLRSGSYRAATTACFAAIVSMQVANVFVCRSETTSALARPPSRPLALAVAFELLVALAIVYTPWGQAAFGTEGISLGAWLIAAPFAALMVGLDAVWKRARASRARKACAPPDPQNRAISRAT